MPIQGRPEPVAAEGSWRRFNGEWLIGPMGIGWTGLWSATATDFTPDNTSLTHCCAP